MKQNTRIKNDNRKLPCGVSSGIFQIYGIFGFSLSNIFQISDSGHTIQKWKKKKKKKSPIDNDNSLFYIFSAVAFQHSYFIRKCREQMKKKCDE